MVARIGNLALVCAGGEVLSATFREGFSRIMLRPTTHYLDDGNGWQPGGLLSLHSAPIMLVPSPGPGRAIMISTAIYNYTFGTAGYNLTGGTGTFLFFDPAGFVYADFGDNNLFTGGSGTQVNGFLAAVPDMPIVLATTGADMQDGDGTASVLVRYWIADLSTL